MGTGSVKDRFGRGNSCCRRCLSPFSGGAWKKGTGTEPPAFFRRFGICGGSEPVPIFHSTLEWSPVETFASPIMPRA